MNDKLEISMNELSHYNSLKKQDLEHRKLIKKLQLEIKALKQGQLLPIDSVSKPLCDVCGSDDIVEYPHVGFNCYTCNPM